MVFQQFNLFPHLTVLENITLAPIHVRKRKKHDAEALGHGVARSASRFPNRPRSIRASFRAASSSAWPSPAPWP